MRVALVLGRLWARGVAVVAVVAVLGVVMVALNVRMIRNYD